ncbi:MAG: N-acetylmuramoyl-L-alanine amidase-like domain-containing protein [Gemmatimonadota bacterium]
MLSILLVALGGCGSGEEAPPGGGEEGPATDPEIWEGDVVAATRTLRPPEGTEGDWEVFRATATMAWEEGLDTLPMSQAMVRIGLSFVGTPYAPGTLELAGEEAVVVNFQELDCVTFVENVLALVRFIRIHDPEILESERGAQEAYRGTLREIRYRSARVDGYASRLHYFSDWIRDNEAKGLVKEMTREMGGEEDYKAIDYMTTHPEAYRQLANMANVMAIQETEFQLSGLARFKIPEGEIQVRASSIQDGDIVAATSTVDGLDVTHTALAYWQGSELYLLHAPLVGEAVEISRLPLAERILRQDGQDGIRVVRPLDPLGSGRGNPAP